MTSFRFFSFVLLVLASVVAALPHEGISNDVGQRYQVRRQNIPAIPPRPEGVGAESFHGSQFQFFDEHGFVAGSPGVEAAPVFLFSRTQSIYVWHASSLQLSASVLSIARTGSMLPRECHCPRFETPKTKSWIA